MVGHAGLVFAVLQIVTALAYPTRGTTQLVAREVCPEYPFLESGGLSPEIARTIGRGLKVSPVTDAGIVTFGTLTADSQLTLKSQPGQLCIYRVENGWKVDAGSRSGSPELTGRVPKNSGSKGSSSPRSEPADLIYMNSDEFNEPSWNAEVALNEKVRVLVSARSLLSV